MTAEKYARDNDKDNNPVSRALHILGYIGRLRLIVIQSEMGHGNWLRLCCYRPTRGCDATSTTLWQSLIVAHVDVHSLAHQH